MTLFYYCFISSITFIIEDESYFGLINIKNLLLYMHFFHILKEKYKILAYILIKDVILLIITL